MIENDNEEVFMKNVWDKIKVSEWCSVALNFDEVGAFMYLEDLEDKLMILCMNIIEYREKSTSKGLI